MKSGLRTTSCERARSDWGRVMTEKQSMSRDPPQFTSSWLVQESPPRSAPLVDQRRRDAERPPVLVVDHAGLGQGPPESMRHAEEDREDGAVLAEVRVVQERHTVGSEHPGQLIEIRAQDLGLDVHQRIEAERQVHGAVRHHGERPSVVAVELDVRLSLEAPPAHLHARLGHVDGHEALAVLGQEPRPTTMARRDLEDRRDGKERSQPRQQRAVPLGLRTAPHPRPLLTPVRPLVARSPDVSVLLDRGHRATVDAPSEIRGGRRVSPP